MPQIKNLRNEIIIAQKVKIAKTYLSRAFGLIPYSKLEEDEGLIISNCQCVHTFFMRFPIDVIFCTKDNKVIHIEHNLTAWRISSFCRSSSYVVELAANCAKRLNIQIDDVLQIEKTRNSQS